ncbi:MAG: hypothetical protein ACJAQ6_001734, partial [Arenicella sp.]
SPEKNKSTLDNTKLEDYTRWKNLREKVLVRVSGIFMRLARFAPDSWLDDEPLLIESHSKAIRDYFADDWTACFDYVEKQSVELGVKRNTPVSV